MMTLWRLSNSDELDGSQYRGGRWLAGAASVVELHSSPLAAICARLALVEADHPSKLPHSYRLLEIAVPPRCIHAPPAPRAWRRDVEAARAFGQAWLDRAQFMLLRVPSVSGAEQFLLNCAHPDMALCAVRARHAYPFTEHIAALRPALVDGNWLVRTAIASREA